MELQYDIPKYISKAKMSSKKRILVEGKDDKSHIKNLLDQLKKGHKVRVDSAENIKGNCKSTAKNNKMKIKEIYQQCNKSIDHRNLFFLCDREYEKFKIEERIDDLMLDHEWSGNLTWTIGHSIENYFFQKDILLDAFRFLCGSAHKSEATDLFEIILSDSYKTIAAIALAGKKLDKASFPCGIITWENFTIKKSSLTLNIDCEKEEGIVKEFIQHYESALKVAKSSDDNVCAKVCRGHTAMLMLQRIFSACLFHSIKDIDSITARKDALHFSQLKECNIASALAESWIRKSKDGISIYPNHLVEVVT